MRIMTSSSPTPTNTATPHRASTTAPHPGWRWGGTGYLTNVLRTGPGGWLGTSPDRIGRLEALPGWAWNTFDAQWDRGGFRELQAYCAEHGAATPGKQVGYPVRAPAWPMGQRPTQKKHRAGQLSEERCRRLETLAGWRW